MIFDHGNGRVEQSVGCVCVCVCVHTITFEVTSDLVFAVT